MSELDRIRWRSRRGLLELDLVLEKFLDKHLQQLTEQQLDSYKDLLFLPDNDLLDFVDGRRDCPDARMQELVVMMRECWTAAANGADR
ncbi:MAG: succinate dehydrogenase assembly factor 2 [Chitinivorax sp.]|jgi:succinate dehydrogenase flavin-adding protein (antitoxin of CptAB toxin-antitoxin module)